MRKLFSILLVLSFLLVSSPSVAAEGFSQTLTSKLVSLPDELSGRLTHLKSVSQVNDYVNSFPYRPDPEQYGREYIASAREFLVNGGGDCEDYVIAKAALLIKNKVAKREDLRIMIVHVPGSPSNHAVLLIKRFGYFLMLDNRFDFVIRLDADSPDYGYEYLDIIHFS